MVLPKTSNVMKRGAKLQMMKESNKNKMAQILDQTDPQVKPQPQKYGKMLEKVFDNLGGNSISRQEAVGNANPNDANAHKYGKNL